jgi:hypothetical protein
MLHLKDGVHHELADGQYHFFTSSARNWQAHKSLRECMRLQENRDKQSTNFHPRAYSVYLVLLPPEAEYKIDSYHPDLPNDVCFRIDLVHYEYNKKTNRVRLARKGEPSKQP